MMAGLRFCARWALWLFLLTGAAQPPPLEAQTDSLRVEVRISSGVMQYATGWSVPRTTVDSIKTLWMDLVPSEGLLCVFVRMTDGSLGAIPFVGTTIAPACAVRLTRYATSASP